MLSNIIVFAVLLWGLGISTSHTLGGFIHVLLIIAAAALVLRAVQRRRIAPNGSITTDGTFKAFDPMNTPLQTLQESSTQGQPAKVSTRRAKNERELVARLLRKNFDDFSKTTHTDGTGDYLVTGLVQAQNTVMWILRRYLP